MKALNRIGRSIERSITGPDWEEIGLPANYGANKHIAMGEHSGVVDVLRAVVWAILHPRQFARQAKTDEAL